MIARKIRPEELKRTAQLGSHAFEFKLGGAEKTVEEMLEACREHPRSQQDLYWDSRWATFLDDDRTMLCTFAATPFRMHFDGHDTLMFGIGGVASLPQYRRGGAVRACLEAALTDMYEQGGAFSYLYPFSTVFYRKFGYELACDRCEYRFKMAGMPKADVGGYCDLLEIGKDNLKAAIRAIDAVWQYRYNCMVIDGDIDYCWMDSVDPFRDATYTYVYFNAQGEAKGYMTYHSDKETRTVKCRHFCFIDAEGFFGLSNLLRTLASDRDFVEMILPPDLELDAFFPEWNQGMIECRRDQRGMVRVINAADVLKMARMRGTGELVIELKDPQIAQNNGRFAVRFEDGVTTAVSRTDAPCDIEMTIQEFSRMICGRGDLRAMYLPDVKLHCDIEKAEKVFYKKPLYISHFF